MRPNAAHIQKKYNNQIQLSKPQIFLIRQAIKFFGPGCNLLVFGCGHDSALWYEINLDGYTLFVENVATWADKLKQAIPEANVALVDYKGITVASSMPPNLALVERFPVPDALKGRIWDVIVIDAPMGFQSENPGRAVSIYWASRVANATTHIFVDDCERQVESAYSDMCFPRPHWLAVAIPRVHGSAQGVLRWYAGIDYAISSVSTKDPGGWWVPLRYFYASPACEIVAFHDLYQEIYLAALVHHRVLHERSLVLISFSWYQTDERIQKIKSIFDRVNMVDPSRFSTAKNVIVVANSFDEANRIRLHLPDVEVILCCNAAFLSESKFSIGNRQKIYDAVLNSKPLAFKRHYLAESVQNKVFITYDTSEDGALGMQKTDITGFGAKEILKNISQPEVVETLQKSRVGLILSEVEGACYSSAEYMLCGLPVISTPSYGGRDEFYDHRTAILADPTPQSIRSAVLEALERLDSGLFDPSEIRQLTIEKMISFRAALGRAISRRLEVFGVDGVDGTDLIEDRVLRSSKLNEFRNSWVTGLSIDGFHLPLDAVF
jgi:glycosyltransferase involved in cell wall biosynthesis